MAFNPMIKMGDNIAAIRIALEYKGGLLPHDQLETLKRYAGFGGLKAVLFPEGEVESWKNLNASAADMRLYPQVMELHRLLKEKLDEKDYKAAVESVKASVHTAYYTPAFLPRIIYKALSDLGITPRHLYEPSSGAGVFITEAVSAFPGMPGITAVEKDILTGKILQAICGNLNVPVEVQIKKLEETSPAEKGGSDLVISNIPFGNVAVFDPAYRNSGITSRIHNYFFAKGLDKLADGGILAYLVTDAFLNTPGNAAARKYVFTSADLLSVVTLPANLMKDNANVEVGTNLIIVQKNDLKETLSQAESELIETVERENKFGKYPVNRYLADRFSAILGDELIEGTNAYGQPTRQIWQNGEIGEIAEVLYDLIKAGFENFDYAKWQHISTGPVNAVAANRQLNFLPQPLMPEFVNSPAGQLGLFDAPQTGTNKALAYLSDEDAQIIDRDSARLVSTVRTTAKPMHDSIVLLTARLRGNGRYHYRLFSNVAEITFPNKWLTGIALGRELDLLSLKLKKFAHDYRYEGDATLQAAFKLEEDRVRGFGDIKPYYVKDTLVIFEDRVGRIAEPKDGEAKFEALEVNDHIPFYQAYIALRDIYLELSTRENEHHVPFPELRQSLNTRYADFITLYGALNQNSNRNKIFNDTAFGFKIIASLETRDGDNYVRSDIFNGPLFAQRVELKTDDPADALAVSLNDYGKVDLSMIGRITGLSEDDVILALDRQILQNPETKAWEMADDFLSGNVVAKLAYAENYAAADPGDLQAARSLAEIRRVQPERIPFEQLDFNLGERWMPVDYYARFATELFKLDTRISYFSSVDTYKVSYGRKGNTITDAEFCVVPRESNKATGRVLLEHALLNTSPYFSFPVSSGDKIVRVPDKEAIQNAQRKIDTIRSRYLLWLLDLPNEDKQFLEKLYNDTYNCYVLREYNGDHLKFPGLDRKALKIEDLYPSQKSAAWRIIQNKGALVDHEVGLGKTLTMIVAAMEMKRLGVVHKPMILALKANVQQITDTFRQAYPKAKLLAPTPADFEPARRKRLFHEIKNNNWDCIILTHDQFGKIPQAPEIQKEIFQIELDNTELDLLAIKATGDEITREMVKGLELRKTNLQAKLQGILYAIENRKDLGVNFREMNVDHLFIDESHKFKNLLFTTRHTRVAGLGNINGSQKSLNMLFAIRTLQQKQESDMCVTFCPAHRSAIASPKCI